MPNNTYNPAYSKLEPIYIKQKNNNSKPPYEHINPKAYSSLEELSDKSVGYKAWCSLIDVSKYIPSPGILEARIKSEKVWHFLANPQSVDFSRSVNWTEQPTLSSSSTMLNYGHTGSGTISLNDILMPCNCPAKNLQEYVSRLQELMVPPKKTVAQQTPNTPSNNDYRAPYLALVWAANVRYPVVIKDIKWKETHWHKGIPTYINLSITLQELPIPLRPNAFGKTGSELDKVLGNTIRENRKRRIEEIRQELQGYYNREGIFAIQNPKVRALMAELTKNQILAGISNATTGNSVLDWMTGLGALKSIIGDDARQQRRDFKRELERNIKSLDESLGNPRFSGADLKKDLQNSIDFYRNLIPGSKPPNLSGLSNRAAAQKTRAWYKQLYDEQQRQERAKINGRR